MERLSGSMCGSAHEVWLARLGLFASSGHTFLSVARDGRVHVFYTWERKNMRHVVIDPTKLTVPSKGF